MNEMIPHARYLDLRWMIKDKDFGLVCVRLNNNKFYLTALLPLSHTQLFLS